MDSSISANASSPAGADAGVTSAAAARRMRAVVQTGYGSAEAVSLAEADVPAIADNQVLVRVRASSVNPVEWYRVMGPVFARFGNGLLKPKNPHLGADLAGVVEAAGKDVGEFKPGDEVFGTSGASWAEYAPAREVRLVRKPANVSFEEAAAVPVAALTALQALRDKGSVQPGQKVLINGASGGVGTFAVQIAKAFGADVTAVCSTSKVDLVGSLGADRVCDYRRDDFTRLGERHDLVLDIAGSRRLSHLRRVLTPEATVVIVGGPMNARLGPLPHLAATLLAGIGRKQRVKFFVSKINTDDLAFLAELLETGKMKPVIDRRYELSRVGDALRYLGEGHARGKVVITMEG